MWDMAPGERRGMQWWGLLLLFRVVSWVYGRLGYRLEVRKLGDEEPNHRTKTGL